MQDTSQEADDCMAQHPPLHGCSATPSTALRFTVQTHFGPRRAVDLISWPACEHARHQAKTTPLQASLTSINATAYTRAIWSCIHTDKRTRSTDQKDSNSLATKRYQPAAASAKSVAPLPSAKWCYMCPTLAKPRQQCHQALMPPASEPLPCQQCKQMLSVCVLQIQRTKQAEKAQLQRTVLVGGNSLG